MAAQVPHNILPPIATGASVNIMSTPSMGIDVMNPVPGQPQNRVPDPTPQNGAEPHRPGPAPLDSMRAYRACLNCRNRKSKCDLDLNAGRPVGLIVSVYSACGTVARQATARITRHMSSPTIVSINIGRIMLTNISSRAEDVPEKARTAS